MSAPLGQVEGHSSVELNDSCNCTECCPRVCCWPRRVKKVDPRKPHKTYMQPHLEKIVHDELHMTETGIKVHTTSTPQLTQSGHFEIDIKLPQKAIYESTEDPK